MFAVYVDKHVCFSVCMLPCVLSPRLTLELIIHHSAVFFTEIECLGESRYTLIWLVLLEGLLWETLYLPAESGITGHSHTHLALPGVPGDLNSSPHTCTSSA